MHSLRTIARLNDEEIKRLHEKAAKRAASKRYSLLDKVGILLDWVLYKLNLR